VTSRLLLVLGRHQGRTGSLLGGLADPERVAHLGQFGLGFTEPGFELARPSTQLGVLGASGLESATHHGGEPEVLLGPLARLCRHPRGELRAAPSRRLAQFEDDGVQQGGGQAAEGQIEDDDETGADARRQGEDRQRGHGGNEAGGGNAPARTSRPVLLVGLALGYSGTHVIHGKN